MATGSEGKGQTGLRALRESDFEPVVEIDRRIVGRSRRGYFEKRLEAALRHPRHHVQLGAERDGALVGFVMARVVEGEFGRPEAAAVLETIGVDPSRYGQGTGRLLLQGLEEALVKRGIAELSTEAEWSNQTVLRFLAASGFDLAPVHVLEVPVTEAARL